MGRQAGTRLDASVVRGGRWDGAPAPQGTVPGIGIGLGMRTPRASKAGRRRPPGGP